mmetsp:Transcript_19792/g.38778  ORF Transcript_19792/g.38778 Transcript_19792/m.38778 type:complete len:771 (+) Transcript_19792:370-2682(+)
MGNSATGCSNFNDGATENLHRTSTGNDCAHRPSGGVALENTRSGLLLSAQGSRQDEFAERIIHQDAERNRTLEEVCSLSLLSHESSTDNLIVLPEDVDGNAMITRRRAKSAEGSHASSSLIVNLDNDLRSRESWQQHPWTATQEPLDSKVQRKPSAIGSIDQTELPLAALNLRRRARSGPIEASWHSTVLSGRPATERISRGGQNGCPLSQSPLWNFQRMFYDLRGSDTWQMGLIPSFATTNVRLAHGYARAIFEFVRARENELRNKKSGNENSDTKFKAYAIEFGAGAGKFGFHIAQRLSALSEAHRKGGGRAIQVVYVLTEVHEGGVQFWKSHSSLQPLFRQGVLDVALVDATSADSCKRIELQISRTSLVGGQVDGPIIGVCNYLFDSLVQDAFQVRNHTLYRAHVEVMGELPSEEMLQEIHQEWQPTLSWTYDVCDVKEDALLAAEMLPHGSQIEQQVLMEQLRKYQVENERLSIMVPLGAFNVVRNLVSLATNRANVMLLAVDKGFHETEEFMYLENPQAVVHGALSFMTNFHLFNRFCEKVYRGAHVRRTSYSDGLKAIAVFFKYDRSLRKCDAAVDQFLSGLDPGQVAILNAWGAVSGNLESPEEALSLLRNCDHDQFTFLEVKQKLLELNDAEGQHLTTSFMDDMREDLSTVMDNYFPLQMFKDVAFENGRVLMVIGDFEAAIALFHRSLQDCGEHAATWLNLGLCHYQCHQIEQARAAYETSLALAPDFEKVRVLLDQLPPPALPPVDEQFANMDSEFVRE